MAGLQRSAVSFRRQGSSGLVWDDKLNQLINRQKQNSPAAGAGSRIERSRSTGGDKGFRSGKVTSAAEPSSPKVSACGFCGAFGRNQKSRHRRPPRSGKRAT
ncbi:hypothetical protein F511_06080 [Dorcoceras hygrometricum]|uniref:Uncharacterized protein n=1 Tax=Dorcoceras hygrometricum TaxID=472368 RepID=A0A2Z7DAE9_9LAMI|nr:hypothetical protein F511_06080 [Dorcoceras hygrometricum]